MKDNNKIELIEYEKGVEKANCITHAIGAFLTFICLILAVKETHDKGALYIISAILHSISLMAVYTISSVYHGLKPGNLKLIFRRLDHVAIPLLQAATATPCALITLYSRSHICCWVCFFVGWASALWGIIIKLYFFSKFKTITMAIYFISGIIMMLCAIPCLDTINKTAFILLIIGCLFYVIGAVFCKLGINKSYFHPVFHVFVLVASLMHFYVIYNFIY